MSGDRSFYVYVIFRLNGVPCYVGKGKGDRWLDHERAGARHYNKYLSRIIIQAEVPLPKVKVRENLTDDEAKATEIALIAAIGRIKNGGPLANLTDGGDGVVGHPQTPEQLAKLSAARKGKSPSEEARAKIRAKLLGRRKTPEHCAAVSAAKKGKPGKIPSDETRAKMAIASTGRVKSEATIQKLRNAHANMTESARLQKSQRISAALTGKKLTPEHRAKISAVQRGAPNKLRKAA